MTMFTHNVPAEAPAFGPCAIPGGGLGRDPVATRDGRAGVRGGGYTVSRPTAAGANGVVTMADATPIVFVVDDDISVRESLELLIKTAGWQPETFA